jgi:hypothetical protein
MPENVKILKMGAQAKGLVKAGFPVGSDRVR